MAAISGTESPWSEIVLRHREFLIEQVEPDFGLVDKLYANGVLSKKEKADINAENTVYKRNTKLLEYIEVKAQCSAFVEALKSSNQTHVVNYLDKNGIYASDDDDDDWPLLERDRLILRTNHETLIEILEVQDLLILLYSTGVISRRQMNFISSMQTYDKCETLLDILSRRSIGDYKKTIRCLHASKQSHIAQILDEGGVMVRAHVEIPDGTTEDEMISLFANLLKNRSTEGSLRILEGTFNVIAVKKGDSIVLYVYCKTFDDLMTLHKLKTSGKLVTVLQKLFIDVLLSAKCAEVAVENPTDVKDLQSTEIYQRSQIEKMTAAIHDEEYDKAEKYFLTEGKSTTEDVSSQDQLEHVSLKPAKVDEMECDVNETQADLHEDQKKTDERYADEVIWRNFPSEPLGIVIRKCFLNSRMEENEMKHFTDKEVIIKLASVQFSWFQRIIKRNLKNKIWRQLSAIYQRNDKTAAMVRNNRSFLESCIWSKGFIKHLNSSDCLTDVQTLMIKRHRSNIVKPKQQTIIFASNLLNEIRSCDKSRKLLSFSLCLRRNGQRYAASVEMKGGVVVKAQLKYSEALRNRAMNEQVVDTLNELIPKIRNRINDYDEDEIYVDMDSYWLNYGGIEILETFSDREVVVWIWCQSKYALEYVLKFNRLESVFTIGANDPPLFTDSRPNISIDLDQFKKEVADRNEAQEKMKQGYPDYKTIPLEVLDIILRKCFVHSRLEENCLRNHKDKDVVSLLSSVDHRWWHIMTNLKGKKTAWRQLSAIYKRICNVTTIIRINRMFLEEFIQLNILIKEIRSANCITDAEAFLLNRQRVRTMKDKRLRRMNNSDLFEYIRLFDWRKQIEFARCLLKTGQADLAKVFGNGGVVIKLQKKRRYLSNAVSMDKLMVERLNEYIKNSGAKLTADFAKAICCLQPVGLEKQDGDAAVWMWCNAKDTLSYIRKLHKSNALQHVYAELSQDTSYIISREEIQPKLDFDQDQFLKDADTKGRSADSDPFARTTEEVTLKSLSSALVDMLIGKCFLHSRLEENEMKHLTDKDVIIRLASVQFRWFQRIIKRKLIFNKRWLKNKIWRQLSECDKTAAILRNNRPFLESCIRQKGFMKQLKSSDCLTDVQALMIKRQKFKICRSKQQQKTYVSDLLHVIRFCDKSRQLSFGRCLRENGQRDAARVAMNGGVVVKPEPKYCDASRRNEMNEEMINQCDELILNIRNSILRNDEEIRHLKRGDIEILGPYSNKEAVAWIWCQSHKALEYIQNAYESNLLAKVYSNTTKDSPLSTDLSPNISIDQDQLKKEVVQTAFVFEMEENTEFLKEHIDPNVKLLTTLRVDGSLTRKEIDDIEQQPTYYQMNNALLKYILTKSRGSQLIKALDASGQRCLNYSLSKEEHANFIIWKIETLSANLTSVEHIASRMYQDNKLTQEELDYINKIESTPIRASEELLSIIADKPRDVYECFLDALKKTNQNHLCQILATERDFENIWKENMKLAVAKNNQFLMENLRSKPLIDLLHSEQLMTDKERKFIKNQPNEYFTNREILQWMHSTKFEQICNWQTLIKCLRKSDLDAIADVLENGGVIIWSKFSSKPELSTLLISPSKLELQSLLKETEELVVEKLNHSSESLLISAQVIEIFGYGIEIIPCCRREDDGIVVWFLCHSPAALKRLEELYKSKDLLIEKLKTLFKLLPIESHSSASDSILIPESLTIDTDDFSKHIECRNDIQRGIADEEFSGMAILGNEVFLCTKSSHEVKVYHKSSFVMIRKFFMKGLENLEDIVVCARKKRLYIAHKIYPEELCMILTVDQQGNILKPFRVEYVKYGSCRLSVTMESNIVALLSGEKKLIELTAELAVIREIELSIQDPKHFCSLPNGNFVVKYGWNNDLCIIDSTGNVVKSGCDYFKQSDVVELSCLTVDKAGSIWVACDNGRLVFLTSDLEHSKTLHVFNIPKPELICLDESTGLLYMAGDDDDLDQILIHVCDVTDH